MAKKFTFNNHQAYQEGPFALVKDETDGLWRIYHIQSNLTAMWIVSPFKQKRDALELAQSMIDSGITWDVADNQSFFKLNDMDRVHTIMSNLTRGLN